MSDDDLFPPDDTTSSKSTELFGSLFGGSTTPQKREKRLIDDLFAPKPVSAPPTSSAAARKRPTVTFQDPPVSGAKLTELKADTKAPSTDLLDSLFSSNTGRRNRTTSAPQQQTHEKPSKPEDSREVETTVQRHPDNSHLHLEVENLRREISTLRYEKTEDLDTIRELRSENKRLTDVNKTEIDELNRKHRDQLKDVEKRHLEELKKAQQLDVTQSQILENINKYQDMFSSVQSKLDYLQDSSHQFQEKLEFIKDNTGDAEKITDFLNDQITESEKKLRQDVENLEKKRESSMNFLEAEFEKLSKTYSEDIVMGRKWIQQERDKLYAERRAFQEEQIKIVENIEQIKEYLEASKSEFLRKEHDLLSRIMNESSALQQREKQFEIQRNADIIRIRKEAEELEACFTQIQNALFAIEQIRKDYEFRSKNLILNFDMISEYLPVHIRKQLALT